MSPQKMTGLKMGRTAVEGQEVLHLLSEISFCLLVEESLFFPPKVILERVPLSLYSTSNPLANFIRSTFTTYPKFDCSTYNPLLCTQLVQVPVISHVDDCRSLLIGLRASILAPSISSHNIHSEPFEVKSDHVTPLVKPTFI